MASTLHPPACRRSNTPPILATTNDGVFPLDLLYEILLRLPSVAICRFRAVCRSWCSLLRHPDFIAAARNPGPLIAIGLFGHCYTNEVNVLDLDSGNAIKRVEVATTELHNGFTSAGAISNDRLVCVADLDPIRRHHLLDLTSGVVSLLPRYTPPALSFTTITVGRTASTREQKLLAISTSMGRHESQVCKILTLGSYCSGWRDMRHPPLKSEWKANGSALIDGIAYFLYMSMYRNSEERHTQKIMAFDLDSETWMPLETSLQGPDNRCCDCLAEIDGQLVAGHATFVEIELWFLVDLAKSYWSKRYTITMPCHQIYGNFSEYFVKPLAVRDDGRIVLWMRVIGDVNGIVTGNNYVMRTYDPRTKTFMDGAHVSNCANLNVFTWNVLHTGRRGAIDMATKRLLIDRRHHHS